MRKMQTVADLLDLQALDLAIDGLLERRANLPELADYRTTHEGLAAAQARLEGVSTELASVTRSLDRLEGEVGIAKAKREEVQVRMYTKGSSAKEVEHLGWEVEQLGRQIEAKEDEELLLLERADELEPEVAGLTGEVAHLEARKSELEGAIKAEWAVIDAELGRKEARKATEVAGIDPDLLGVYERIRASKGGMAVAPLTDGICGSCHVGLSTAEIYALRSEELPRCVHCGRLVVL
jgi:uncharacterized protein